VNIVLSGEAMYRYGVGQQRELAIQWKAEAIEALRRKREKEERDKIERQARFERQKIEGLVEQARLFRVAKDIREYVDDVRTAYGTVDPEMLAEWAKWALAEADRIDPVLTGAFLRYSAEGGELQVTDGIA
jgi:hypothetical protein